MGETPTFLGLCDGVSQVSHHGISPDEFPKELIRNVRDGIAEREAKVMNERAVRSWPSAATSSQPDGSWLAGIIEDAYKETEAFGATTLLMAVIEETNRLMVANLGDCTGLLLRREPSQPSKLRIVYKTEAQRYDQNRPYQAIRLNGVPEEEISNLILSKTRVEYLPAQHGDLIVLGTDGVFDNLHDEDVTRIIEQTCVWSPPQQGFGPGVMQQRVTVPSHLPPSVAQLENAADAIVGEALSCVCVGQVDPATGGMKWPPGARQTPSGLGGKADDTTVIVGVVVQTNDAAAHEDFFYRVHGGRGWFGASCCGGTTNLGKNQCVCS